MIEAALEYIERGVTPMPGIPKILVGCCLETMRDIPDQSVHTCVTSPPYFGLRDYQNEGQIGLETTPDEYVARLVEVFREVRRVLRDDGTAWLNLGDSYAAARGGTHMPAQTVAGGQGGKGDDTAFRGMGGEKRGSAHRNAGAIGMKHKDLIGIPWRVAFALQADGWYLRQDIIWHKPNPMPESVRDRCTKAHEYMFLLSKGPRYYFDAEAIKEDAIHKGRVVKATGDGSKNANAGFGSDTKKGFTERNTLVSEKRNRRSVWTVTAKPYKGAHFATFPPDLIEPCVLAGCPSGGIVLDPFGGSGTTAGVAIKHGRRAILCELNPEYANLIPARVQSIVSQT